MAKQKQNKQQAHRASFLDGFGQELHPEGSLKDTAISTVRDLVVGVVVGGAVGAAIGKPSLIIGAVVTGVGHYKKIPLATLMGIGMMAANGFQSNGTTVKGVDKDVVDGIKDRLEAYKESFQEKLFLDKILKKKEPVNGMGKVQYFSYPNAENFSGNNNALDMSELDRIQEHIHQSAQDFAERNNVHGLEGANEWMETGNY